MTTAKRTLLIEDDRYIRRACEMRLRQLGLFVVTAADGEEGLRLALADPPDLVLLDMLMPKMTGLEVLRAMKADARTTDVPVLIISNSSREQDVAEVLRLGAADYLVKANLSLDELSARVTALLGID